MPYLHWSQVLGPHVIGIVSALILIGMLILVARLPKRPQSDSSLSRRSPR